MNRNSAKQMALGGVMAALAVVIMCLGSILYLATFVCPVICCLILKIVTSGCGRRIGWAWYGAVSVLCLLLCPDKEAATTFVFFGYYPLVKPILEKSRLSWLWKLLLFNISVFAMYSLLIYVFGMAYLAAEFAEAGAVLLVITLVLGNCAFWMLDLLLGGKLGRRRRG